MNQLLSKLVTFTRNCRKLYITFTIVDVLDVQVSGPFAAQFRPKATTNIVRTVKKSVNRRPTHAQKKREPGSCQFLVLVFS